MNKLLLIFLLMPVFQADSFGGQFYYEFGGGVGNIRQAGSFFNNAAPANLGFGGGLSLGIAYNIAPPKSTFGVHFGLIDRFVTGSATESYFINSLYPMVRFEGMRIYLTFGISPLNWRRHSTSAGFDSFNRAVGALGILTEIGYSWPITPEVTLSLSTSAEAISSGGTYGPRPILGAQAVFRFFIGKNQNFKKEKGRFRPEDGEAYEGYRYPYGAPR